MSLITNGPHTVTVFLEEGDTDWRGNIVRQASATPVVVVGCFMQPVSSSRGSIAARDIEEGQRVTVQYHLIARQAPVGPWAAVEWVDPDSGVTRRFTPLGGPQVRGYTPLSSHTSVTLQEVR